MSLGKVLNDYYPGLWSAFPSPTNTINDYNNINWAIENPPSKEEIQAKIQELETAEPMRLLRQERNRRLQETDWTQYRDVSLSNDSDWQTYRQSLRDLPQNFSPIIDIITEDGYPIVKEQTDWPEKPS